VPTRRTPTIRRIGDRVEVAYDDVVAFLGTPAGRKLRTVLAGALIATAPMIFRVPGLRRYPLIRTLEVIGGAALVVKFAESLRDWEPTGRRPIVIDVPPARRSDVG
jgi:hypothetical protein